MVAAGTPVWIDTRARIAHEKALVIDRRVTTEGSYNFLPAPLSTART